MKDRNNLGKPRKKYFEIKIPANTTSASETLKVLEGPSKSKQWQVFNMAIGVPAKVGVSDFSLNGENLGLYSVGGDSTGDYNEFDVVKNYGQQAVLVDHGDSLSVKIVNITEEEVTVGLTLFLKEYDV